MSLQEVHDYCLCRKNLWGVYDAPGIEGMAATDKTKSRALGIDSWCQATTGKGNRTSMAHQACTIRQGVMEREEQPVWGEVREATLYERAGSCPKTGLGEDKGSR